jgi:hypothetical protein
MTRTRRSVLLFALFAFGPLGCDKRKEAPPEAVTPQLPIPQSAGPVATPAPTPAPPPRPAVSRVVPTGIVLNNYIAGGHCNLEYINGHPVNQTVPVKIGTNVRVAGWAFDKAGKKLPEAVHLRFDSKKEGVFYVTAATGIVREDVSKDLNLGASLGSTGFEASFDSGPLPAGDFALTLLIKSGDKTYICDNGRKIHVES